MRSRDQKGVRNPVLKDGKKTTCVRWGNRIWSVSLPVGMLRNAVGGCSAEGFEPAPSVSICREPYAFVSEFVEFCRCAMSPRTKKGVE